MIARSEDAVKLLGPPRAANHARVVAVLEKYPVGTKVVYEGKRSGAVVDVSACGRWLLIERHETCGTERDKIAVLVNEIS
jgi:hypothetical protein